MVLRVLFFRAFLVVLSVISTTDILSQYRIPNRYDFLYVTNGVSQIVEKSARYRSKTYYNYDANGCIASVVYCERNGDIRESVEYDSEILSDNVACIRRKSDKTAFFVFHHESLLDSVSICDGRSGREKFYCSFKYDDSGNLVAMRWETPCAYIRCDYEYGVDTIVCKEYHDNFLNETRTYVYSAKHELRQVFAERADKDAVIADVMPWDNRHYYMYCMGYSRYDKHGYWTRNHFVAKKGRMLRLKRKIVYRH